MPGEVRRHSEYELVLDKMNIVNKYMEEFCLTLNEQTWMRPPHPAQALHQSPKTEKT